MSYSPMLADLVLSRSATDRRAELRKDPEWIAQALVESTTLFICVNNARTLVHQDDIRFFAFEEIQQDSLTYFLGLDGGVAFFGVSVDTDFVSHHDPDAWLNLRASGSRLGDRDAGLLVAAVALDNWNFTHTHCSRCGSKTVQSDAGWTRRCPTDDSTHFPRTDPAVIVLVTDASDRVLLARQSRWPAGWVSVLAGFVEAGESAEAAVVREVGEETGITIDPASIDYLGSQPWPFPNSLMLGYQARAINTEICVDGEEIVEAHWYSRADIKELCGWQELHLPPRVSIAHQLITRWYGEALPSNTSFR
jgi:NAD+ diphosphatase